MGDVSAIEWTDATWNPTRGCSRVSPGCTSCYAERLAARFSGPGEPYHGLVRRGKNGPRWTGEVPLIRSALDLPLRWRKPRRIFVNSMSDLFHEALSDEDIAAVFGVMAACPQHTFQVLTKRAERMRAWFDWAATQACHGYSIAGCMRRHAIDRVPGARLPDGSSPPGSHRALLGYDTRWPLPNVWIGVSVEDQKRADERIPILIDIPAKVRFVSAEPLLEDVDLRGLVMPRNPLGIHWVIVGGESGPGARPFDLGWARSIVAQCRREGTACFFKQAGSRPVDAGATLSLKDRKGGDPLEWPEDLRVQQWPEVSR